MKNNLLYSLILVFLLSGNRADAWESKLLSKNTSGQLTYYPDSEGYILPDFSHAGYKGGGVDIPQIRVVEEVIPIEGDNTAHLQQAINRVGTMPVNAQGIRGAILLKKGFYEIKGTLSVPFNGVVLRGEDKHETVLVAVGDTPHQRDVLVMGNPALRVSGTKQIANTRTDILDEYIPVGAFSFRVNDSSIFRKGDRITIFHPASSDWLQAIDFGGVPYPDPGAPDNPDERWREGSYPIIYNRFVKEIRGDTIDIHAPIFYSLDKRVSPVYVYKPNMSGLVDQVGLENLTIDIQSAGGTDENHAWQAVRFKSCENSWASDCVFIGFGQSGIITEACLHSTFRNCEAVDPVGIVTGERMYNFNTSVYSQLNLFEKCYARNGRHHYVSNGTSSASGNVFLHCVSEKAYNVSEGHRHWTQGMLYDNHREINLRRDFVLGLYNRVAMGTGHGWSAVHSVLWNCDVDASYGKIALQKPPTAQNYAIGCQAQTITGNPYSSTDFPLGYVEGQNKPGLEPASLYQAQLEERFKKQTSLVPSDETPTYRIRSERNTLTFSSTHDISLASLHLYTLQGIRLKDVPQRVGEQVFIWRNLPSGIYHLCSDNDSSLRFKCLIP